MSALVIPFPRWRRTLAGIDHSAVLRRVRFAALHAGCDGQDVTTVERYAAALLDNGHPADAVVQASRSFAAQLYTDSPSRA